MASIDFSWTRPEGEDDQEITYRLHENGKIVVSEIGEPKFSLIMDGRPSGDYAYQVSSFRMSDGQFSEPGDVSIVNFTRPLLAPTGLIATLSQ